MEQEHTHCRGGTGPKISRRSFLQTVGAGVITVTFAPGFSGGKSAEADTSLFVNLTINKTRYRVQVEPRYTLLFVIRDMIGLNATKVGCERGECGACTVIIDGKTQYACMTLAVEAEGREVTTLEGLMDGEKLGDVQQAFLEEDAFQCGFCTPGQIMATEGMLKKNSDPDIEDVREGLSGNLCRCGTYKHIYNAVRNVVDKRKGGAE